MLREKTYQNIMGKWMAHYESDLIGPFPTQRAAIAALRLAEPEAAAYNKPSTPCSECHRGLGRLSKVVLELLREEIEAEIARRA